MLNISAKVETKTRMNSFIISSKYPKQLILEKCRQELEEKLIRIFERKKEQVGPTILDWKFIRKEKIID